MAVLSGATASGRQMYQGSLTTTTTTLYTAPAASSNVTATTAGTSANSGSAGSATAYIKEIILTGGTTTTVSMWIVPSGGSPSTSNVLLSAVTVNGGDVKILTGLNTMMPADSTIQASAGAATDLTVTISGTEVQ